MKKTALIILATSLVSSVFTVMIYQLIHKPDTILIREEPKYTLVANDDEYRPVFSDIASRSTESVVFIRSISQNGKPNKKFSSTTGSGVLVSPAGYIVTNEHLIKDTELIEVTLSNKRVYKAKVTGTDSHTDLAVIKIEDAAAKSLPFGDSDSLSVGDWVLAIGNPYKLNATVTAGIVSAKARNLDISNQLGVESFIQTDAAVNPGNSGGALVNLAGELIGINTAIISNSGTYEGLSFAIPSNIVSKVVDDIRAFGSVQRAWLGITITDVDDNIAKSLNLESINGVLIKSINRDGAALKAGIAKGDVILSLNNVPTDSRAEFNGILARYSPGESVEIKYFRDGKVKIKDVTLHNYLNTTELLPIRKDAELTELGIELRDLSTKELSSVKNSGVKVISITRGSSADQANMEPNYIIHSVNGHIMHDVDEFVSYLQTDVKELEFSGFYIEYPGYYPYKILR